MDYVVKDIDNAITRFRDDFFFLSSFYEGNIFTYKGFKFNNTSAPFQGEKFLDGLKDFEMKGPAESKSLGRKVLLRDDWEKVKEGIMYDVCYEKFSQDENLKRLLLSTGNRELIEGNFHGDRYWGMTYSPKVKGFIGKNRLGLILMKLREDLRAQQLNK